MLRGWSTAPWPWISLLVAAGAYSYGVHTLRRGNRRWSRRRSLSYTGALLSTTAAVVSPLATHDELFGVHMVQHMLLGMLAPLLFAFSAPVTLALRTLPPNPRKRLISLLHSPLVRVLANPLTVTALFLGGIYGVYFTPIYEATLRHPALHNLVHLHLLVSGCLFAWAFVAVDPVPRIGTNRARLALLFIALGGHEAMGKFIYAGYSSVVGVSADQLHLGAGIMYYGGDLVDVAFVFVFCRRWYVQAGRQLHRQQHVRRTAGSGRVSAQRHASSTRVSE